MEFRRGDLIKVTRGLDDLVFYTVVYNVTDHIPYAIWKGTSPRKGKRPGLLIDWYDDIDFELKIDKEVCKLEIISRDKNLSKLALEVFKGSDLQAKDYVEELIKQHDKEIK